MTRPSGQMLALVLGAGPQDGATVAALRLLEQALARGHRVAVYAYGDGARVSARASATAAHVAALVHRGVHTGPATWVVDAGGARPDSTAVPGAPSRPDGAAQHVAGVLEGDGGDLWRFVRDADVVLGVQA